MRKCLILLPLLAALSGCLDIPKVSGGSKRDSVRQSTRVTSPRPETRQCLAELGMTRANFTPLPDRYTGGGCSILGSVQLASLQGDAAQFTLSNLGPVTCPAASAFAGWARFGVDRAARQILGSPLARIETMGSYSCRTVAGTSRLSGHAKANAIDVAAFVLADGRRISVLDDWSNGTSDERRFLRIVHRSACKRFGTTLGPEYNAAHRNHFHLEADAADFCR
ncbi:extensin family protein [Novosphingobium aquimarinum]|uniref:extensin family protein n=1 Tax=Novosphingobium aquimarinum TaxID=2682494 RepID=UPI0012EC8365|nr:extensin family protein [Novosphingobium aquimarinum]